MKHLLLVLLFLGAPVTLFVDAVSGIHWRQATAAAQPGTVSVKDAFEAARELGTIEAWNAFLKSFPNGFYADLARAYINSLTKNAGPAVPPNPPAPAPRPAPPVQTTPVPAAPPPAAPPPAVAENAGAADLAPTDPTKPAVARSARFMGFPERFNRHYTDPSWKASRIVYVSPNGSGNGNTRDTPASVRTAIAAARPGTRIHFVRGNYQGCFQFTKENSGTYDEPIVLYGERNEDQSIGVAMTCCNSGRRTCFNLEGADYVAIDGFELIGGQYGVRAVGEGFAASQHSRGVAVLNSNGHDQDRDPFFSGAADWAVWEGNKAHGAKKGDGHGIYLSNGADWNIVRFNETFGNVSSDFQINADPTATCKEVGIAFNDPRCDAYAGTGEGGQGASDYFLVDSNYFHHGAGAETANGPGSGPNFTSVRRSVVRNNVFGFYARHGVSFWQETDNPRLGSSDNRIVHNLFVTTNRHGVQFKENSTRNEFANNILLGIRIKGGTVTANPSALLMEVDGTVGANVYRSNLYVSGRVEGRTPGANETARGDFQPSWFTRFPTALNHEPNDFTPTANAPFLGMSAPSAFAPADRNGVMRAGKGEPGPIAHARAGGIPVPNAAAKKAAAPKAAPKGPPTKAAETPAPRPAGNPPPGSAPRAVTVARATAMPACTVFVDAAVAGEGKGTAQSPHRTIAAAVAAAGSGAVICVAEGTYAEQVKPGEKPFVLAGGFQRGQGFKVRDSAAYVSKAQGKGGSFIRIEDPGPKGQQLTVIDGFEISGYSQAIFRDYYESQRFDITNNHIHDNTCSTNEQVGGGVALNNVTGRIEGNVFRNNRCGRGGAIFVQDTTQQNTVTIERNLVDNNHGTEPDASHGGAVYVFGKTLRITGNLFTRNSVTQWGGGLYIGAWTEGKQFTTANLNWNVYRRNRAGNGGGGMFCDEGATCNSYHEVYDGNCGSNIYLDSGSPTGPTIARFYHLTNVSALDVGCKAPGAGVRIDNAGGAPDNYAFINALFWGNAPGIDFVATCDRQCDKARVTISHSMVQTKFLNQGLRITFGDGIMEPVDPLFADAANGDLHLKSTAGRWTPDGRVQDLLSSPALGKGYSGGKATDNPERAGNQIELGAYGNSGEASYVR